MPESAVLLYLFSDSTLCRNRCADFNRRTFAFFGQQQGGQDVKQNGNAQQIIKADHERQIFAKTAKQDACDVATKIKAGVAAPTEGSGEDNACKENWHERHGA